MTTPPDKCPKCGAEFGDPFGYNYKCGRSSLSMRDTDLCIMTQRANCEHERAEKWKACADGLAWDFVQYLGDAYSPNKATYDALMKEEQK